MQLLDIPYILHLKHVHNLNNVCDWISLYRNT